MSTLSRGQERPRSGKERPEVTPMHPKSGPGRPVVQKGPWISVKGVAKRLRKWAAKVPVMTGRPLGLGSRARLINKLIRLKQYRYQIMIKKIKQKQARGSNTPWAGGLANWADASAGDKKEPLQCKHCFWKNASKCSIVSLSF